MIRRAVLKAIAIPGHQVPFASREMPLPYGWGTGGIQVTAALIGRQDILKVIDQGADDTVNAVSIRRFFERTTGVGTTADTSIASLIQSRHRIPETPLGEQQILILQVPIPEPLRGLVPSEQETRKLHADADYDIMRLKLYEDIAIYGGIISAYDYPVLVHGRYLMRSSPVPRCDTVKLNHSPAVILFGAGREKRIFAVPPYTDVVPLDYQDRPFTVDHWSRACSICGSTESFLDEVVTDNRGGRIYVCSDTDYCRRYSAR